MESRVTRLETEFTYVRRDLDEIRQDVKGIRETMDRVSADLAEKPGKGFVIGTVIAIFGLSAGVVAATIATLQYVQGSF
ncbi:hypothetical protein [Roseospira goensis]|uniref:Uncharacterized protein n=1 Tax=Roseospira goensis TaxID=391922 RepID=A0A7W6WKZ1_9PROT|nr:hypothetical protein [Roseospira goensis]MBB4286168.1 hypothetical protein [Roseospira goensis]